MLSPKCFDNNDHYVHNYAQMNFNNFFQIENHPIPAYEGAQHLMLRITHVSNLLYSHTKQTPNQNLS